MIELLQIYVSIFSFFLSSNCEQIKKYRSNHTLFFKLNKKMLNKISTKTKIARNIADFLYKL